MKKSKRDLAYLCLQLMDLNAQKDKEVERANAAIAWCKSFDVEDGKLDVTIRGHAATILAAFCVEAFDSGGGINFVEWTVSTKNHGPMTMTLQRRFGKTPAEVAGEFRDLVNRLVEYQELFADKAMSPGFMPGNELYSGMAMAIVNDARTLLGLPDARETQLKALKERME